MTCYDDTGQGGGGSGVQRIELRLLEKKGGQKVLQYRTDQVAHYGYGERWISVPVVPEEFAPLWFEHPRGRWP